MLVRLLSTQTKAKLILGAIGTGAAGWMLLPGGEPTDTTTPAAQVAEADADSKPAAKKSNKSARDGASTAGAAKGDDDKEDLFSESRWDEGASAGASDEPKAGGDNEWPNDDRVKQAGGASSDPFAAPSYRNQPAGQGASAAAADGQDPFAAPAKAASNLIDQGAGALNQEIEEATGIDARPLTDPLKQAAGDAVDRYGAQSGGAGGWDATSEASSDAGQNNVAGATDSTIPPLKQLDYGTAPGTLPPLPPIDDEGYSSSDIAQEQPAATGDNPLRSNRNGDPRFGAPPVDAAANAADVSDDPFGQPSSAAAADASASDEGPLNVTEAGESDPFAAPKAAKSAPSAFQEPAFPEPDDAGPAPGGLAPGGGASSRATAQSGGLPRGPLDDEPLGGVEESPEREVEPAVESPSFGAAPSFAAPEDPAFVQPPPAATRTVNGTYTSRGGESLFDVARRELGSPARWVEIYELNENQLGATARRLPAGLKLRMPER